MAENNKYKKKAILSRIKDKWGYYKCGEDIVLVKNCIKKDKYNKIYQLVYSEDKNITGLFLINSYDIDAMTDSSREKQVIRITHKKYDKYAGCDGSCEKLNFEKEDDYFQYLKDEEFINDEEILFLKNTPLSLDNAKNNKDLIEFILRT